MDLLTQHQHLSQPVLFDIPYVRLLPFVHQAGQQAFGVINDLRCRLPKRRIGIIAKSHDASIRDLLAKEVSQPELLRFGVRPGREGIAAEAVDGYDTVLRVASAKCLSNVARWS